MAGRRTLAGTLILAWLGLAAGAHAAPEEIQVYMDDMDQPGHFGLDLHNNWVFDGAKTAPYPGGLIARHTYRFTPEFSYGISPNLEGGLYVLSTVAADGTVLVAGEKVRLKFIAPRPADQHWYWGLNLEVGREDHAYDPNPWNGELKGIFGYHDDRWVLAINPNVDWTFSNRVHAPPTAEVDTKVGYKLAKDFTVGVESYDETGALKALGRGPTAHNVYGVVDASICGWDLNLGLGWGLTRSSDGLVAKAIVSVPFG